MTTRIPEPDQTPEGPAYEGRLLHRPEDEVVDQGVAFDVTTLMTRRRVLGLFGIGAGAMALAACTGGSSTTSSTPSTAATAAGEIPEETNGPYPADGSNGVNVLEQSGIVRSDIRTSLGSDSPVDGVPLDFTFTLTDLQEDGAAFAGAAVYLWQCDAEGRYSMYSEGVEDETFLRGVQVADDAGKVTFTTVVPGCYTGRWTHLHFEVYPDLDSATDSSNAIATSQVAFPEDMLGTVYALDTYPGSARNLAQVGSLESDNVFSDGVDLQLGTFTGDASGYTGSLPVAIDTETEAGVGSPDGGGGGGGGQGGPPGGDDGQPPEPPS